MGAGERTAGPKNHQGSPTATARQGRAADRDSEAYQFDCSHEVVLLNGATVIVKAAHVRLCHSRTLFVPASVSTKLRICG